MKNIIFIFLWLCLCSTAFSQNSLSANLQTGSSVMFKIGLKLYGLPNTYYFQRWDDVSWDKNYYPSFSIGATYETPTLKLLVSIIYSPT